MNRFDQYDIEKLQEARVILLKVLDLNYCDGSLRRMVRRLDTIVIKLGELIEMNEKS